MLCRNSVQWGRSSIIFCCAVLHPIFVSMLSYWFRWFLVFLQYHGSLLQKHMQIFYFVKNGRKNRALCCSCKKKKSLALAKSKTVDLLPCYCVWLLIFYQVYDKQNSPSVMPKGRQFFDNSARRPLTTSQKGLFKETTSMAFSEMPGI